MRSKKTPTQPNKVPVRKKRSNLRRTTGAHSSSDASPPDAQGSGSSGSSGSRGSDPADGEWARKEEIARAVQEGWYYTHPPGKP